MEGGREGGEGRGKGGGEGEGILQAGMVYLTSTTYCTYA